MSESLEKEIDCVISGKVQGVWYREFAKSRADQLEITGHIRNCEDGTVEVIAQGSEEKLRQFITLLKKGSTFSKVEDIKIEWQDKIHDTFTEFSIG